MQRLRRLDEAFAAADRAVRSRPDYGDGLVIRGRLCYRALRDTRAALRDATEGVQLAPDNADGHDLLAWLLVVIEYTEHRDGPKAVHHARRACELTGWKNASYVDTLAAAHARCGDFDEAVKWQTRALEDKSYADGSVGDDARKRLELYRRGAPYPEDLPPLPTVNPRDDTFTMMAAVGGGMAVIAITTFLVRRLFRRTRVSPDQPPATEG